MMMTHPNLYPFITSMSDVWVRNERNIHGMGGEIPFGKKIKALSINKPVYAVALLLLIRRW